MKTLSCTNCGKTIDETQAEWDQAPKTGRCPFCHSPYQDSPTQKEKIIIVASNFSDLSSAYGFDIYSHSGGEVEAVKRGFSWPAFFFSWIWASSKKLWNVAFVLMGLNIVSWIVVGKGDLPVVLGISIVVIVIPIIVAISGNAMRRAKLTSLGYKHDAIVVAEAAGPALYWFLKATRGDKDKNNGLKTHERPAPGQ